MRGKADPSVRRQRGGREARGDRGTHVLRLQALRPTFAPDMSDEEHVVMDRHAAYRPPLIDSGPMVVFGPVLDGTGSTAPDLTATGPPHR